MKKKKLLVKDVSWVEDGLVILDFEVYKKALFGGYKVDRKHLGWSLSFQVKEGKVDHSIFQLQDGNFQSINICLNSKTGRFFQLLGDGQIQPLRDRDRDLISAGLASGAFWLEEEGQEEKAKILQEGRKEFVNKYIGQLFEAAGTGPNARNEYGETPLHIAAKSDENPANITALIESGADLNARDDDGRTPLHFAVSLDQNPAITTALLEGGADPNALNKDGDTPLHFAARSNENPAVITVLLEGGADPKAKDEDGKSTWDYAKNNEALEGTEALLALE